MSGFGDALLPVLPEDAGAAALVGRIWLPELGGPSVVAVRDGALVDITAACPTVRDLCEAHDPAGALRAARGEVVGPLDPVLANTRRRPAIPPVPGCWRRSTCRRSRPPESRSSCP